MAHGSDVWADILSELPPAAVVHIAKAHAQVARGVRPISANAVQLRKKIAAVAGISGPIRKRLVDSYAQFLVETHPDPNQYPEAARQLLDAARALVYGSPASKAETADGPDDLTHWRTQVLTDVRRMTAALAALSQRVEQVEQAVAARAAATEKVQVLERQVFELRVEVSAVGVDLQHLLTPLMDREA